MSDDLFRHYETELFFLRKLLGEFGKKYPAAAARLKIEPDRSADPHVERLIEAFALIAGRVRHKIEDDFPELTDAMLGVVYPHLLAPIPSFATVQFELPTNRAVPEGVTIPVGSPIHTARVGDQFCKYRTAFPLKLWPIAVEQAKLVPPPYPSGLNAPAQANAALRLRLRCTGEFGFEAMNFEGLSFHLMADNSLAAPLYDLLFGSVLQVQVFDPENPRAVAVFDAKDAIRPVGFGPAEELLPYPVNVFPGYRLLTEYFSYQPKFLYFELAGWESIRRTLGPTRQVEFALFLDRSHPRLEQVLTPAMLKLGCTPIVNIFEQTAEPIPLAHTRTEYRITPSVGQPLGHEVYSIQKVSAAGTNGTDREYRPFFHFRHGADRHTATAFWSSSRRPSPLQDDRGTDVYLHLADTDFNPHTAATDEAVVIRLLCTNRDLPNRLPRTGEEVRMEPGFASAGAKVRCLRNPTPPLRPPAPRGRYWHLISHLNLNHLPFSSDGLGLDALKGILSLYDSTDPETEPQAAAQAKLSIEGLVGVGSRRSVAWLGGEIQAMVRGVEMTVELDETKFVGTSGLLFASVLERFLGLSVGINSFCQTVARFKQRDGEWKRWAPRAGEKALL